jgi:pimeloyl-ACP methyl ester carboxylesterase
VILCSGSRYGGSFTTRRFDKCFLRPRNSFLLEVPLTLFQRDRIFGKDRGAKEHGDGIVAFSQTDFTEDLKKITVPALVLHGDDDQIVPYADAGPLSAKLLRNSTLKIYRGFPHGMPTTEADTINADLLSFLKGIVKAAA